MDPERLELGRSKVIRALAASRREMSSREMCRLLDAYRPAQRHQILESLHDEERLAIRLTCTIQEPVRFHAYYRLGARALTTATTIDEEGGAS